MAHLENKSAGMTIELGGATVVIGSEGGCTVVLAGDGVSPEHAEIQAKDDGYTVVDLESRAGTRVNGRYVNQHTLIEGDVIRIGDHELTFRAGVAARSAAPAARPVAPARGGRRAPAKKAPAGRAPSRAPSRAQAQAPARGARAAPPPGDEELAAYDAEAARRERMAAKRKNAKRLNVVFMAIPTLLVLAFVVFKLLPGEPVNTRVASRMLDLNARGEFAASLEVAKEAVPTNDHSYERIQKLSEEARFHLAKAGEVAQVTGAQDAWNQVRLWRQDNFENDDEFVARIDAFLAEHGRSGGPAVEEAKNERVKITGKATNEIPKDAAEAWKALQELAERTKTTGTFGETLRQADAFWEAYGVRNLQLRSEFDALKKTLHKEAGFYFGRQAFLAKKNARQGASGKARRILAEAVDTIGLPEFEEKAAQVLKEIGEM